ncbi:nitrate/nitrite two-component system sensor histidine kinase NarQ [Pasteurellaceae bacterium HPA106]|uniref:nitrate/nitrite two-component system sensor histidine kinase NarQ n=1 Tax=Spirabiliibacterium pneumoniae TaxID=221400 RepID=UPI001AAD2901|nr:nitrate/nitrite two-component system sensor histidine kinase NarQ [Spirabiliibacterium pneumoniae]MBE2896930.1 nitrate/nitrite two-component system sensor histidine kinase NarQ [Spirabiliibacterium pneumoniae]
MLFRHSLTKRLAYYLLLIVLLSGLATGVTTVIMVGNQSDAEMINVSGSLRMQSYRLLHDMDYQPHAVGAGVALYQDTLRSPTLVRLNHIYVPNEVQTAYRTLLSRWQEMEGYIRAGNKTAYRNHLSDYVNQVDHFVSVLQTFSERQLMVAIYSNICALLLMVAFGFLLLGYSRKKVVEPLGRLVTASQQVQNGQFEHLALDVDSDNELGVLSRGFTQMAKDLKKLYDCLEHQVNEKTHSLTQINRTLSMLYFASQRLSLHDINQEGLHIILSSLRQNEALQAVRLLLNGNEMWNMDVGEVDENKPWHITRIAIGEQNLGQLNWQRGEGYPDLRTIENIAQMLGRALYSAQLAKQQQQLLLMQERSIIARELHDSLAQVLAFLQIQLTLLKRAIEREMDGNAPKSLQIVSQFETALSDGYTQLRELLATFRLTVSESNLALALQEVIDNLQPNSDAKITLECALPSQILSAQQQIHLLQIVREAVLNSIKHANASLIEVIARPNADGENEVIVRDNGVGIGSLHEPSGHYGLNIMAERAQELNATLNIMPREKGGTEVRLCLPNCLS